MKWILFVSFLSVNLMAASTLSELPADVQKEIKGTEEVSTAAASAPEDFDGSAKVATAKEPAADTKDTKNGIGQNEKVAPTVDRTTAKETEIPISVETTKKVAANESPFFRIILVVALLGVLAVGTWFFVRKNKFQNVKRNKNEIKILAQHYLGPKKSLAVVRVAGESILVGITDMQINLVKTLSLMDDEFPDVTSSNFASELNTRIDQDVERTETLATNQKASATYNRKSQINTKTATHEDEMDEFSIRGIKDLVSSKLKNMRSI